MIMNKSKKELNQKSQSKKKEECRDQPNNTNTIHAQNEEIENGEIETGDQEKKRKNKSK